VLSIHPQEFSNRGYVVMDNVNDIDYTKFATYKGGTPMGEKTIDATVA
jgi:hypothetical protein